MKSHSWIKIKEPGILRSYDMYVCEGCRSRVDLMPYSYYRVKNKGDQLYGTDCDEVICREVVNE